MATYEHVAKIAGALLPLRGDVPDSVLARTIGSGIYDTNTKFSGIVEDCFADHEGYLLPPEMRPKICEDHRINRQFAGTYIVNLSNTHPDHISSLIENEFCVVNYVRPETNTKLAQVQKKHFGAPWEFHYETLGVKTVQVKGRRGQYVYFIEDKYYGTLEEVKTTFGIDAAKVAARCNAKKKWADWKAVPYTEYIKSVTNNVTSSNNYVVSAISMKVSDND